MPHLFCSCRLLLPQQIRELLEEQYNGTVGGTKDMIAYAEQRGVETMVQVDNKNQEEDMPEKDLS